MKDKMDSRFHGNDKHKCNKEKQGSDNKYEGSNDKLKNDNDKPERRVKQMVNMLDLMERFRLKKDPFVQVNGDEIYRSARYRKTIVLLKQWLTAGSMCAVTGPPGSGKSTMLNDLAAGCKDDRDIALVHCGHPDRNKCSNICIYQCLEHEFAKEGVKFSKSSQKRFLELKEALGRGTLGVKHIGIVLDEAHRYKAEFLRGIKELSEISWAGRTGLIGVVFVGWPEFESRCRQLAPDISRRLNVGRKIIETRDMMGHEIKGYLQHRGNCAGRRTLFEDGALNAIGKLARTPIEADTIALEALDAAYRDSKDTVNAAHVLQGRSMKLKKEALGVRLIDIAEKADLSETAIGQIIRGKSQCSEESTMKVDGLLNQALEAGGLDKIEADREKTA